jgi:hypothetical protein
MWVTWVGVTARWLGCLAGWLVQEHILSGTCASVQGMIMFWFLLALGGREDQGLTSTSHWWHMPPCSQEGPPFAARLPGQ